MSRRAKRMALLRWADSSRGRAGRNKAAHRDPVWFRMGSPYSEMLFPGKEVYGRYPRWRNQSPLTAKPWWERIMHR